MDLNIRKFPDEVAKEAKIQAIDLGVTLQEWVVAAVRFALTNETRFRDFATMPGAGMVDGRPKKGRDSRVVRVTREGHGASAEAPAATVGSSPTPATKVPICNRCDAPAPRDPKNPKYFKCSGQCRRQLDEWEVKWI